MGKDFSEWMGDDENRDFDSKSCLVMKKDGRMEREK